MQEKYEGQIPPQENESEQAPKTLDSIEGLEATLHNWCNVFSEDESLLSFDQVVKHMADNKEVRKAVLSYLSFGGAGYEFDCDPANAKREELTLALAEEFERRYDEKE